MKNLRKILTIGIVVAGLLLPHLAHAVTLLSEGFEGTCEEVRTRWPYQGQILLGQFPCIHPMTINTDLRFVRSGSQSLKMQYEGGEIYGGAATHAFADNTRTEIWVTYDTYMRAPFYTGGDTSAGVGGVNTKGLYTYMNSPTSGARRWGWVPGWSWGTRNHNLGTQGCFDNLYNGVNVPYTSTTFFQNKTIVEQPWDTWVRHEVHYKLNTPGQANGLLEEYQTVGNGPRTLTTQYLNRQCLDNFLGGEMPSDARWFSMQIYRQYGNGELYIDNLTVTTEAVGSGGTVPPPPPPAPTDTSPPNAPTSLTVSGLWDGLKMLVATVWQWLGPASADAAVANDKLTLSWTSAPAGVSYELRWQSFAHSAWIDLGLVPSSQLALIVPLAPPVACPAGRDCYVCADARAKQLSDGLYGPWLSETPAGKSCNQFAVGPIVLPPPPDPIPVPIIDTFRNILETDTKLSFQYAPVDCPKGITKSTSTTKNGLRTVTLTCTK